MGQDDHIFEWLILGYITISLMRKTDTNENQRTHIKHNDTELNWMSQMICHWLYRITITVSSFNILQWKGYIEEGTYKTSHYVKRNDVRRKVFQWSKWILIELFS